jgi:hypothetical protein
MVAWVMILVYAYQGRRYQVITNLKTVQVPLLPVIKRPVNLPEQFPESFPLQVAVLLTRDDEGGLGLVHAFQEMGIPFFVTRSLAPALRHSRLFIYPEVDGNTFTSEQAQELAQYVQAGGTVFAQNVIWGVLKPLFGFRNVQSGRSRHWVTILTESHPLFKYLDRPEEKRVRLANETVSSLFTTNGYTSDGTSEVLASFEDGSAALLGKSIGRGTVFVSGVGFDDVILRSQCNRHFQAPRAYVNAFEPGGDVWMLILRAWYENYSAGAVRLATAPQGERSWVMLSHDIDWENSVSPALAFARMETRHHTSSTFFMQTKYISDMNGRAFFSGANLAVLSQLTALGFDVESHTVIHARGFNQFSLGTGFETYATYRPHVARSGQAQGATVMGEVRVSKELLDGAIAGHHTVFFRAGHLRFPPTLAEALVRCGYEFDSSFTAPDVMSNFPFVLTFDRDFEHESPVYEFPVTIEDEENPPLPERLEKALEVIQANADNGAVSVVLIHTNDPGSKVPAEEFLLNHLPRDIGVSDMLSFARFWRARDLLKWRVLPTANPHEVILKTQSGELASGFTFEFAQAISSIEGDAELLPDHHRMVLPVLAPGKESAIHILYQ